MIEIYGVKYPEIEDFGETPEERSNRRAGLSFFDFNRWDSKLTTAMNQADAMAYPEYRDELLCSYEDWFNATTASYGSWSCRSKRWGQHYFNCLPAALQLRLAGSELDPFHLESVDGATSDFCSDNWPWNPIETA